MRVSPYAPILRTNFTRLAPTTTVRIAAFDSVACRTFHSSQMLCPSRSMDVRSFTQAVGTWDVGGRGWGFEALSA